MSGNGRIDPGLGPNMTTDDAGKVKRPPVKLGEVRTFYSTMQGPDAAGLWPALYSGRECEVLAPVDVDPESEAVFRVRFGNGDELEAFEGELTGWYFDTGQWHGPFAAGAEADWMSRS